GLRYRVIWESLGSLSGGGLSGLWLVVASSAEAGLAAEVARAVGGRGGADVRIVEVDGTDRTVLGAAVADAVGAGGGGLAGVVSLLGLDETAVPGGDWAPAGVAATAGVVQAVVDGGFEVPVWA
ncbi:hypothetical protein, partial [Streptomyces lonarensis]